MHNGWLATHAAFDPALARAFPTPFLKFNRSPGWLPILIGTGCERFHYDHTAGCMAVRVRVPYSIENKAET